MTAAQGHKRAVAMLLALSLIGLAPGCDLHQACAQRAVPIKMKAANLGQASAGLAAALRAPRQFPSPQLLSGPKTFKLELLPKVELIPGLRSVVPAPEEAPASASPGAQVAAAAQAWERLRSNELIQGLAKPENPDAAQNLDALYDQAGRPKADGSALAQDGLNAQPRRARLRKSVSNLWGKWEREISGKLKIALQPGQTSQWASATADWLRNYPAAPLETAMAKALAQVHGLSAQDEDLVASFFSGATTIDSLAGIFIDRLIRTKTGIYAVAKEELYFFKNGQWISLLKNITSYHGPYVLDDSVYVFSDRQVFRVHGDQATRIAATERFDEPVRHKGKIYLPLGWANLLEEASPGNWRPVPSQNVKAAGTRLFHVHDNLFAGDHSGLYKKAGRGWKQVLKNYGAIIQVIEHLGKIYVSSVDMPRWKPHLHELDADDDLRSCDFAPHEIFKFDGQLYGLEQSNLYRLGPDGWSLELSRVSSPNGGQHFIHGRELLVRTQDGLFRCKKRQWQKIHEDPGPIHGIVDLAGKRYILSRSGLYEVAGERWTRLLQRESIRGIYKQGDNLFLATESGAKELTVPKIPDGWKARLLDEIEETIARKNQAAKETANKPGDGYSSNEKGEIVDDETGRAIFNGFAMPQGAAKTAAKTAKRSRKTRPDIWSALESLIDRALGLGLESGQAAQWRQAAGERLRNEPASFLETVLAETFAKVHGMAGEIPAKIISLLNGDLVASSLDGYVFHLFSTKHGMYAVTSNGLYFYQDKHWEPLLGKVKIGNDIHELDGKLYVGDGAAVYEIAGAHKTLIAPAAFFGAPIRHDRQTYFPAGHAGLFRDAGQGRWEQVPGLQEAWRLAEVNGELYVGTLKGIYKRQGEGWSLFFPNIKVHEMTSHGGKLYVTGDNLAHNVHILAPDGSEKHFAIPDMQKLIVHAGSLYLLAGSSLFELGPQGWIPVLDNLFSMRPDFNDDKELYMRRGQGLYRNAGTGWERIHDDVGIIYGTAQRAGKRFLSSDKGLYEIDRSPWTQINHEPYIRGVLSHENGLFIGTRDGVKEIAMGPAAAPRDWKERILKEIGDIIAGESASEDKKPAATASEPFFSNKDGDIVDDDGRTIFSGSGKKRP
ncbi:MAG TPA: hypothetical protein DEB40_06975 [Elusimicrobia bacterium]|nr:hypothetical protein [Elusimicrobiota bacterium]HBT61470.1 hypothetical protein [Elusimicrobiota bacterium]